MELLGARRKGTFRTLSGHNLPVPTSSQSIQTGSIDDGRLEELLLRLDRLETLMLQLPEKLIAAESKHDLQIK